jgi:hypothetical protein
VLLFDFLISRKNSKVSPAIKNLRVRPVRRVEDVMIVEPQGEPPP